MKDEQPSTNTTGYVWDTMRRFLFPLVLRVNGKHWWTYLTALFSCLKETQYSKWKAACILASKGKTMAYSSYRTEVKNIQSFLQMKSLAAPSGQTSPDPDSMDMNAESFVSPRYVKKYKTKQVRRKACEQGFRRWGRTGKGKECSCAILLLHIADFLHPELLSIYVYLILC